VFFLFDFFRSKNLVVVVVFEVSLDKYKQLVSILKIYFSIFINFFFYLILKKKEKLSFFSL